jgi:hypothetical protein
MRNIRSLSKLTALFSAAALSLAVTVAPPASAAPTGPGSPPTQASTWTVSPGGNATGKASNVQFKDTATGTIVVCKTSTKTTIWVSGSGLSGVHIIHITKVTFITCTVDGITVTITIITSTTIIIYFNALSYKTGVTTGKITGLEGTVSGTGCSASIAGTSATTPGTVKATYTNSTGKLKVLPTGGTLHAWNVSGCFGLINNGDPITLSATYKVSPQQTMTSP